MTLETAAYQEAMKEYTAKQWEPILNMGILAVIAVMALMSVGLVLLSAWDHEKHDCGDEDCPANWANGEGA